MQLLIPEIPEKYPESPVLQTVSHREYVRFGAFDAANETRSLNRGRLKAEGIAIIENREFGRGRNLFISMTFVPESISRDMQRLTFSVTFLAVAEV